MGFPLVRLIATKYLVVVFHISQKRINELCSGTDSTLQESD
jgi:UDP-N-acetyl-D-galactosamine dehydrogenase